MMGETPTVVGCAKGGNCMHPALKRSMPRPVKAVRVRIAAWGIRRRGRSFGWTHYCPICRSHVRQFEDCGRIHVWPAEECPICGSHRRHRMMGIYFNEKRAELF